MTEKTLDDFLREAFAIERAKGVADAIRTIKGMGTIWPDAVNGVRGRVLAYSVADDYGRQFVRRILESCPQAEQFVPYGSRKED